MTESVVPEHVRAAIHAGDVAQVVVYCDRCRVERRVDVIGKTPEYRLAAARQHLADTAGWTIRPQVDLCPDCAHLIPSTPSGEPE